MADEKGWKHYYMYTEFENNVTNLAENFMDVPHTVFVHKGWFRDRKKIPIDAVVEKTDTSVLVTYDQSADSIGFNSKIINPKGLPMRHSDNFYMPNNTLVDYIFGDYDRGFIITSTCTPVSESFTRVFTLITYKFGWMNPLASLWLPWYTRKVIEQDVDIMKIQGDNLKRFDEVSFESSPSDLMHLAIEQLREASASRNSEPQKTFKTDIRFSGMSHKLSHHFTSPARLEQEQLKRMYRLMEENYDCVSFAAFKKDLSGKDYVSLLVDENLQIQGFSTYALNPAGTGTENYNILFSGDTIINPEYWGSRILAKSWAEVVGTLLKKYPAKKLYWLLISKGHRTFMYLPVFFNEFVPHIDMEGKAHLTEIAARSATKMFGQSFKPKTGLIEFEKSHGQLKESLAHGTVEKQQHEWINFFVQQNPRFYEGVELVCLAEISEANMKPLGWRMIEQGMKQALF
ncbi:MAG: hypothetical protein U5L96_06150 [Owenweeksia sp.]|nr:hypothetical protein [Owenweeksia sp.]